MCACLVSLQADKERRKSIRAGRRSGPDAAAEAFGLKDSEDQGLSFSVRLSVCPFICLFVNLFHTLNPTMFVSLQI